MVFSSEDMEIAENASTRPKEAPEQIWHPALASASNIQGRGPFRCTFCSYKNQFKCRVTKHTKIKHFGERPFHCSVCSKRFGLKIDLQRHMLIHLQKKPFVCPFCNTEYRHSNSLKNHLKIHENKIVMTQ